jgi:two-component system, OmpR family, sensor kinase
MSLRLRLTLISTAVLTAVLAIFGAGVYVLLERNLRERVDAGLEQRADEVVRATRVGTGETVIRTLGFSRPNTYVQIVDQLGEVVAQSDALGPEALPVDQGVIAVGRGARPPFTYDTSIRDVPLRVRASTLRDQFGLPSGTVMIAASLDEVEETLAPLRKLLILAGLAGIALAWALGWRSARTALRPVEEIAETAQQIGATGDLTRRVPAGGEDELGRLTETFNTMLQRLEEAQAALSRSLATQRRFVDDASHELRTPLTIMRGNLELVARNPDMASMDRRAALRDSIAEAEHMTRLVDDLLALARVDAGMPLPEDDVTMTPLVEEVVDRVRAVAGDRIVSSTIAPKDVIVRGSAGLLRRLLENLTDNAVKYTSPSGAVSVSLVEEDGWAVVTVADDGQGMTADELAHAFDRFWRSDASREQPGSGLGLSIAKAVAEAHGGRIDAASEPDSGTTFTVRLPVSPTRTPSPTVPAEATIGSA